MPCASRCEPATTWTAPSPRCASRMRRSPSTAAGRGRRDSHRPLTPDQIKQRQDFAIQQNITTLRNRVDELGVTEPIVAPPGHRPHHVQLPGVQDPNEALRVWRHGDPGVRLVDDQNDALEAERTPWPWVRACTSAARRRVLLKRDVIASGEQL